LQSVSFPLKQSKELAGPPDAQNPSTVQIPLDNIHLDAYTRLVIMEDQVELNEQSQAKSANKRTHLTESELQELLEVARKTDVRAWAMFALAFNHGLRVSEVTALRLTSFNWKDRTVTVARLKGSMTTTQSLVDLRGNPTMSDTAALKEYLKVRIEDGSGLLFVGQ
jgi:integrase